MSNLTCVSIVKASYVSKQTGEEKEGLFAKMNDSSEIKLIGTVEENIEKIKGYKESSIDPKSLIVVRQGEYGPYAVFSQLTVTETIC